MKTKTSCLGYTVSFLSFLFRLLVLAFTLYYFDLACVRLMMHIRYQAIALNTPIDLLVLVF